MKKNKNLIIGIAIAVVAIGSIWMLSKKKSTTKPTAKIDDLYNKYLNSQKKSASGWGANGKMNAASRPTPTKSPLTKTEFTNFYNRLTEKERPIFEQTLITPTATDFTKYEPASVTSLATKVLDIGLNIPQQAVRPTPNMGIIIENSGKPVDTVIVTAEDLTTTHTIPQSNTASTYVITETKNTYRIPEPIVKMPKPRVEIVEPIVEIGEPTMVSSETVIENGQNKHKHHGHKKHKIHKEHTMEVHTQLSDNDDSWQSASSLENKW